MANVNWLKRARVNVPKRSGFDKSFRHLFTTKCGTLVPILTDEVIPNTRINLRMAIQGALPPLASDTFMNVKLKTEAFFVPNRLLYGGYEYWLTGETIGGSAVAMPFIRLTSSEATYVGTGTLADYLGFKAGDSPATTDTSTRLVLNALPFIAYHKIYDDWYRNTKVQQPVFIRPTASSSIALKYLPYQYNTSSYVMDNGSQCNDGKSILALRQRNFGSDYFSEATTSPQQGTAQSVSTSGNTFTISALRAANSIQQWLERNNLAGFRLQDYVRANYGASLSDGVAQRSLYLGSCDFDIYTKGVEQTAGVGSDASQGQPFSTLGTRAGSAYCSGDGLLIDDFVANEPGHIMVIASLVPKVVYASGIDRMLSRYTSTGSQSDLATPLLQNVGPQPIYSKELNTRLAWTDSTPSAVFGYIDRYADFMTKEDRLSGQFRRNATLQSFAAQRYITGTSLSMGSSFLEIPTTYLDTVLAASTGASQFTAWCDSYFDYKVSMPLSEFCQPSLQDPAYEHGKEVSIRRSGSRL